MSVAEETDHDGYGEVDEHNEQRSVELSNANEIYNNFLRINQTVQLTKEEQQIIDEIHKVVVPIAWLPPNAPSNRTKEIFTDTVARNKVYEWTNRYVARFVASIAPSTETQRTVHGLHTGNKLMEAVNVFLEQRGVINFVVPLLQYFAHMEKQTAGEFDVRRRINSWEITRFVHVILAIAVTFQDGSGEHDRRKRCTTDGYSRLVDMAIVDSLVGRKLGMGTMLSAFVNGFHFHNQPPMSQQQYSIERASVSKDELRKIRSLVIPALELIAVTKGSTCISPKKIFDLFTGPNAANDIVNLYYEVKKNAPLDAYQLAMQGLSTMRKQIEDVASVTAIASIVTSKRGTIANRVRDYRHLQNLAIADSGQSSYDIWTFLEKARRSERWVASCVSQGLRDFQTTFEVLESSQNMHVLKHKPEPYDHSRFLNESVSPNQWFLNNAYFFPGALPIRDYLATHPNLIQLRLFNVAEVGPKSQRDDFITRDVREVKDIPDDTDHEHTQRLGQDLMFGTAGFIPFLAGAPVNWWVVGGISAWIGSAFNQYENKGASIPEQLLHAIKELVAKPVTVALVETFTAIKDVLGYLIPALANLLVAVNCWRYLGRKPWIRNLALGTAVSLNGLELALCRELEGKGTSWSLFMLSQATQAVNQVLGFVIGGVEYGIQAAHRGAGYGDNGHGAQSLAMSTAVSFTVVCLVTKLVRGSSIADAAYWICSGIYRAVTVLIPSLIKRLLVKSGGHLSDDETRKTAELLANASESVFQDTVELLTRAQEYRKQTGENMPIADIEAQLATIIQGRTPNIIYKEWVRTQVPLILPWDGHGVLERSTIDALKSSVQEKDDETKPMIILHDLNDWLSDKDRYGDARLGLLAAYSAALDKGCTTPLLFPSDNEWGFVSNRIDVVKQMCYEDWDHAGKFMDAIWVARLQHLKDDKTVAVDYKGCHEQYWRMRRIIAEPGGRADLESVRVFYLPRIHVHIPLRSRFCTKWISWKKTTSWYSLADPRLLDRLPSTIRLGVSLFVDVMNRKKVPKSPDPPAFTGCPGPVVIKWVKWKPSAANQLYAIFDEGNQASQAIINEISATTELKRQWKVKKFATVQLSDFVVISLTDRNDRQIAQQTLWAYCKLTQIHDIDLLTKIVFDDKKSPSEVTAVWHEKMRPFHEYWMKSWKTDRVAPSASSDSKSSSSAAAPTVAADKPSQSLVGSSSPLSVSVPSSASSSSAPPGPPSDSKAPESPPQQPQQLPSNSNVPASIARSSAVPPPSQTLDQALPRFIRSSSIPAATAPRRPPSNSNVPASITRSPAALSSALQAPLESFRFSNFSSPPVHAPASISGSSVSPPTSFGQKSKDVIDLTHSAPIKAPGAMKRLSNYFWGPSVPDVTAVTTPIELERSRGIGQIALNNPKLEDKKVPDSVLSRGAREWCANSTTLDTFTNWPFQYILLRDAMLSGAIAEFQMFSDVPSTLRLRLSTKFTQRAFNPMMAIDKEMLKKQLNMKPLQLIQDLSMPSAHAWEDRHSSRSTVSLPDNAKWASLLPFLPVDFLVLCTLLPVLERESPFVTRIATNLATRQSWKHEADHPTPASWYLVVFNVHTEDQFDIIENAVLAVTYVSGGGLIIVHIGVDELDEDHVTFARRLSFFLRCQRNDDKCYNSFVEYIKSITSGKEEVTRNNVLEFLKNIVDTWWSSRK